jgi:tRNA nucleotidyltransferase (CCA-adding enzyme)
MSEVSRDDERTATSLLAELRRLFPGRLHDRLWVVGGSVRDHLTGAPVEDADLVAELRPEELEALGFRLVAARSTAPIYFRGHRRLGKIEVTVLPSGEALEADLVRRDFRCNALAMTLDGAVLDPLGGRADIAERLLVPCAPTALAADPIRIFRAFRFAAHGWRLSPEVAALIDAGRWEPALSAIPVERFSRELLKALSGGFPERFLAGMAHHGVGRSCLPELFAMPAVPAGPPRYHPEGDLLAHSLQALERMAARTTAPAARLSAFFHDLGKLATPPETWPRHLGHDAAGAAIAAAVCDRLKLPSASRRAAIAASRLHLVAARWDELRPARRLQLAEEATRAGIAAWLPDLVGADRNLSGDTMPGWEQTLRVARMTAAELDVDPATLARLPARDRKGYLLERRVTALRRMNAVGTDPVFAP